MLKTKHKFFKPAAQESQSIFHKISHILPSLGEAIIFIDQEKYKKRRILATWPLIGHLFVGESFPRCSF